MPALCSFPATLAAAPRDRRPIRSALRCAPPTYPRLFGRRRRPVVPAAFDPARGRHTPTAEQHRAALSPPRRDQTHRAIIVSSIIVTWLDCRVAAKSKASAELALAEIQRSRFFCEHRSPPSSAWRGGPVSVGKGSARCGRLPSRSRCRVRASCLVASPAPLLSDRRHRRGYCPFVVGSVKTRRRRGIPEAVSM